MANQNGSNSPQLIVDIKANTGELNQSISEAQKSLGDLGKTNIETKSVKNLKQQLKEANDIAQKIGQTLGTNNTQYAEAVKNVAKLKDEIDVYNRTVAAFDPGNKLNAFIGIAKGAVGAVMGVSGAMTVLGINSETAQETIAKLQGLMAMTEALNAIGDLNDYWKGYLLTLGKTTIAQDAQTKATKGATIATKGLGMAFKAIGIGLIVSAIAYLVSNFDALKEKVSTLIPYVDKAKGIFNEVKSAVVGVGNAVLQFAITPFKTLIHLIQGDFKAAVNDMKKGVDVVNNFNDARLKSQQKQLAEASREKFKKLAEEQQKELDVLKAQGRSTSELERQIWVNKIAAEKKGSDEQKKVMQDYRVWLGGEMKKSADEKKAADDKAVQQAKTNADKTTQQRKTDLDEIKKIEEDSLKSIRQSNQNARQRELDDVQAEYDKKKKAYEKYGQSTANLTTAFNQQKLEINKKYDDLINQAITEAENKNLSVYEQKKIEINKKIDELLKNATDDQKKLLEASRSNQISGIDKEKELNTVLVNAEVNLVKTESENVISDRDTPEQATAKLMAISEAKRQAEDTAFELKKQQLQGQNDQLQLLQADHNARIIDIDRQKNADQKALDDAQYAYKVDTLGKVGDAVGVLGELVGQDTVAGKSLAIAQATINTFLGATEVLRNKTTIPEPWGSAAKIASMTSVITTGLLTVKKIASVKVNAKGGSGGNSTANISAPNLSNATAPVVSAAALNQSNQIQEVRLTNMEDIVIKTYLTDRDLKDSESRAAFLNRIQQGI